MESPADREDAGNGGSVGSVKSTRSAGAQASALSVESASGHESSGLASVPSTAAEQDHGNL
jgi:hypothetical protein